MKEKGGNKHGKSVKANAAVPRSVIAGDTGKLSKQERRNLNKQKKAGTLPVVTNAAPTAHTESVYKRETVYPPSMSDCGGPWDRFVTPEDPELPNILATSYDGCVVSTADKFKPSFHAEFQAAMEGLDREGYYQFDLTQPAGLGTKMAKTFVTRCLVGDAGTTYKYLGLRMFSIPWNSDVDGALTSPSAVQVGRLNKTMVQHSADLLRRSGKEKVGSCQYNLTLINRYANAAEIMSLKLMCSPRLCLPTAGASRRTASR
jgi:alpha-ketoglutarate-dependent dioxygenase FTO